MSPNIKNKSPLRTLQAPDPTNILGIDRKNKEKFDLKIEKMSMS